MSREELQQKSRFAMIGTLMTIVSLVFLFYVGRSEDRRVGKEC